MVPARIIKVVSRQRRRRFAEHSFEAPARDVVVDLIKWEVGKPKSTERHVTDEIDGVEDEGTIDLHSYLAAILEKPPSAGVSAQVARRHRWAMLTADQEVVTSNGDGARIHAPVQLHLNGQYYPASLK